MVRSIGIDPGDRMACVVELDGSYRKTRLVHAHTAPIGAGDDPMRPDVVAEAVREAISENGMKGAVTLGHPCREAVLRTIELPFKGADAIRKVVKAEIEGEIYTHSVDDMVVDFHEVGQPAAGGTRVLVASVPKLGVRNQLTSLDAQNVDVESVDLDTMGLWRVADWLGVFDDEDDDEEADDGQPPVHALVDLGARSVKVILTEGDQLVEMRVLRLGDAVVAEQVARAHGVLGFEAAAAVDESLRTGGDVRLAAVGEAVPPPVGDDEAVGEAAAADDLAEAGADDGALAPASRNVLVTYDEVDAAHTRYLQRLARELTRFLTATGMASRLRSVWVSGSACRGKGVAEMLEAVFGVAPQELDVLGGLAHDFDEAEAAELSPKLAIAVGLALRPFGGPAGFELRREDLAQSAGFDRIKFPLAIACMVALIAMLFYANTKAMELGVYELKLGQRYHNPKDPDQIAFHGLLHPLFQMRWLRDPEMFGYRGASGAVTYDFNDLVEEVDAAPVHRRLQIVYAQLKRIAEQKQKQSGVFEDVSLESGLAVLVRWAELLKRVEPELGRCLVPHIDLDMKARKLSFTIAFRGEDFRVRMGALRRAIEEEVARPDSPFWEGKNGLQVPRDELFKDSGERNVPGAYYDFEIEIKEKFEPFGPSSRVGALDAPGRNREEVC